jgi:transcriptional regulator with XRE-family HTH domain
MTRGTSGQNGRSAEDRRIAARDARRRWAHEVSQALTERRLTINAAAKAMGISPGRLQAWLSQDVEPSPRVMADLAHVIGRRHGHLLQLLDWLPPELSDVPLRLEATEKLQEAMAEAQRWVEGASDAVTLGGGALVASALLEATDGWEVALRNTVRGARHPVRHSTLVALCRTGSAKPAGDRDGAGEADTERDRREVEALIPDVLTRTAARWLRPDEVGAEVDADPAVPRPDLVLSVPVLGASRPRGARPNLVVPPSIVVVGVPDTGGPSVASLLAGMLDWAYFELTAVAREQFGLDAGAPQDVVDRAETEVAMRLLERPDGPGRLTVWSYSGLTPILQTFREIGSTLPLVVLLQAPDGAFEQIAQRLGLQGSPDIDLVEAAQSVARRTLLTKRDAGSYVILDVPDLPLAEAGAADADPLVDARVELAFQAATWLHERHGGPPLDTAEGLLGDLWRGSA